ncbi:MAG: prepilin-type N-terminal cleavage/methylation domain-containing protein [Limnohabitans sp.]
MRGFTLIELLVVVALIAVATAGVTLSLRDSASDALERDAQRLAAVLESARAQSRANGTPVTWQAQAGGFALQGLPHSPNSQAWLSEQTRVQAGPAVVLGPEPLIQPRQILLYSALPGGHSVRVVTDGLRPFEVRRDVAGGTP